MGIGRGLAALGALAGGYVQGDRMLKQDEERKAETDWKTEERNRLRQNWTLEDNKRNAITEAYRPRTAADGVVTDGAKGAETVVVNPVDTVALNAPQAQNTRAVQALRSSGDPMAAMSLENSLRANELGGVQLEVAKNNLAASKASAAQDAAFKDITTNFVRQGWSSVPKIYEGYKDGNTAQVVEDGKGGATIKIFGEDGKPKGEKKFANEMEFITGAIARIDPKMWVGIQEKQAETARVQGNSDRDFGLKQKESVANVSLKNSQSDYYSKGGSAGAAAATGGKPPIGYRPTKSGNLEPIPGGPADTKIQGALNADTAALTGSISSFDRLAASANEVLNHPGLDGITGWRGKIPNAPGTDASDAEALLGTLKSQVGFGVLQDMRNNSKSGGALGSVSDAEGKRLEANLAALEKSQSPEQFRANLKKIVEYAEQAKGRMRESYNLRHPNTVQKSGTNGNGDSPEGSWGTGKTANVPANLPRVATPADAMKLPSGTVFVDANGVTRTRP